MMRPPESPMRAWRWVSVTRNIVPVDDVSQRDASFVRKSGALKVAVLASMLLQTLQGELHALGKSFDGACQRPDLVGTFALRYVMVMFATADLVGNAGQEYY